jgi:hypothetical protein
MTVWLKYRAHRRFVDDGLQRRPSSTFSSMTVSNSDTVIDFVVDDGI